MTNPKELFVGSKSEFVHPTKNGVSHVQTGIQCAGTVGHARHSSGQCDDCNQSRPCEACEAVSQGSGEVLGDVASLHSGTARGNRTTSLRERIADAMREADREGEQDWSRYPNAVRGYLDPPAPRPLPPPTPARDSEVSGGIDDDDLCGCTPRGLEFWNLVITAAKGTAIIWFALWLVEVTR